LNCTNIKLYFHCFSVHIGWNRKQIKVCYGKFFSEKAGNKFQQSGGIRHEAWMPFAGGRNNRELKYLRFTFVFDGIQVIAGLDTRKKQ